MMHKRLTIHVKSRNRALMFQKVDDKLKIFTTFAYQVEINITKDMIKEYHALNFELVNLIKNDLSSASMAMPS